MGCNPCGNNRSRSGDAVGKKNVGDDPWEYIQQGYLRDDLCPGHRLAVWCMKLRIVGLADNGNDENCLRR